MNISFIGFGNMAKAMAKGLSGNKSYQIRAAAPSLIENHTEANLQTYTNNLSVLPNADVLILAVKPKQMTLVLNEIKGALANECLVISIASGLKLSWFEKHLPNTAIVRAMPNIAVATQLSATPLKANSWATEEAKLKAEGLFNTLGITTWIDKEEDMNAFTALSGSGPAYILLFMEAMIKAGIQLGLLPEVAKKFTLQTVRGTLSVADQNNASLMDLRQSVTSSKGTTEAAINVLQQHDLEGLLEKAIKAAHQRAQQLGKEE